LWGRNVQERKECKALIKQLISKRRKGYAGAKSRVKTDLVRTVALFDEPQKIAKEANDIMSVSYRAFSAAEATYKVLQPVLSSYFVKDDSKLQIGAESLRKQLANDLTKCVEVWGMLTAAETKTHQVIRSI
jgi:4'-phosphopantetheinyl transferase EntD